jgi:hypothetical protein
MVCNLDESLCLSNHRSPFLIAFPKIFENVMHNLFLKFQQYLRKNNSDLGQVLQHVKLCIVSYLKAYIPFTTKPTFIL